MVLGQHRRAIGVLPDHQAVEQALTELKGSGFDLEKVSVIAKDSNHPDQLGSADMSHPTADQVRPGAETGAVTGTALGGLGGLLVGLGTVTIPSVGQVVTAGTVGTTLATTLAGSGVGAVAGGLAGAFSKLGISEERARVYSHRVTQGDYVMMLDGTDEETHQAESILSAQGIQEWGIHNALATKPDGSGGSTTQATEHQVSPRSRSQHDKPKL